MRKDMSKIVREIGRAGGRVHFSDLRRKNKFNDDEVCSREPMKIRYQAGWETKSQRYSFNAIHRFIISKNGHQWDKVYSEICKVFRINSQMRNTLDQYLANTFPKVERINSKFYCRSGYWAGRELNVQTNSHVYNGILKIVEPNGDWRRRIREKFNKDEKDKVFTQDKLFVKINDIWFKFDLKYNPPFKLVWLTDDEMKIAGLTGKKYIEVFNFHHFKDLAISQIFAGEVTDKSKRPYYETEYVYNELYGSMSYYDPNHNVFFGTHVSGRFSLYSSQFPDMHRKYPINKQTVSKADIKKYKLGEK